MLSEGLAWSGAQAETPFLLFEGWCVGVAVGATVLCLALGACGRRKGAKKGLEDGFGERQEEKLEEMGEEVETGLENRMRC